ncbi:hypothetical protein [Providencia huaxiensis]|uniref:hypothetical protein n=1 Tax=Providencia huaxiensis TaxID=2027290 RepID=UPI0032D9D542
MILSLFLGALVCLILFLPTFFTIRNRSKEKKKLFLLDENSLQSQPLFWTVIALPLAVGVMLWAAIGHDYDLEFTSDAYSRLMKNAQFPFVILALSPILGAFVMYGHRSLQTFTQINATNKQIETAKSQLEEAQKKNKVDIYHSKKRFLIEEIKSLKTKNNEYIEQVEQLYYRIFFISDNYNDVINTIFFTELDGFIKRFNEELEKFLNVDVDEFIAISHEVNNNINKISSIRDYTSLRVIKDITNEGSNERNFDVFYLSLKYDEIQKHMQIGIGSTIYRLYLECLKSKSDRSKNEIASLFEGDGFEKRINEMSIYDYFISELITEVKSTFYLIKMISLFTLENKKIYETLPNLEKGYAILDNFK